MLDEELQRMLKTVRRDSAHRELMALSESIKGWIERQRKKDENAQGKYMGRHKTQLETLESLLLEGVEAIHEKLVSLDMTREVGEVYRACRDLEEAALCFQRLWEFFKSKFDQRNDERVKLLLRAADEVVWSCYHGVFQTIGRIGQQKATPLPYIEPQHSPGAIHSDTPLPRSLRLGIDMDFLDKLLEGLPISILRLPPVCVNAPWWLVYVAHEVGHYIIKDLELLDCFAELIVEAVEKEGAHGDLKYWTKCGEEIFADLFSVMMMGPWAVWTIAEAEWTTPTEMVERKDEYPAPCVRLAMMAYAIDQLMPTDGVTPGSEGTRALHGLIPDEQQVSSDIAVAKAIVDLALEKGSDRPCALRKLCKFDPDIYTSRGVVNKIGRDLFGDELKTGERRLEMPRQVASASLYAWSELSLSEKLTREQAEDMRSKLVASTLSTIIESAPDEVRGIFAPGGKQPLTGRQLADKLFEAIHRQR